MKDKFELFEINCLIYFIMQASFIGVIINNITTIAKEDSYLCMILGTIIGIFIVCLYTKLININPNKNINENILYIFGDKIGRIIIILLSLFIFSFGIIILYNVVNFIISEYLYYTPNYAVTITLTIPIIYLLSHNVKVICRTSIILFFISFTLYILSIIGLIGGTNFSNLLPILSNGSNTIIKGTTLYIAYTTLPLFLITIIPKNRIKNCKNFNKKVIKYYLLSSIITTLTCIILLSVLGVDLATLYNYPSYHMLSKIALGGFIKRIESLLAIQWIICIYFMLVFINYYIKSSLSTIFCYNKYFSFIIPVTMMYFSIIIFKNNTISLVFEMNYYPYLLFIFLLIIPFIIYIVSKKRNKT